MSKFQPLITDEVCSKIGQTIHKLRLKKGATQNEMAFHADVSAAGISELENGKRSKVYLTTLIKIANYFEVPLQDLIA